ncbi:MAG: sialate O-acetylesterase, partial [Acidobacteriota bacterium]
MRTIPILMILAVAAQPMAAELGVNGLFGDGMVLQRGTSVPVWGTADPGATVEVTIAGRTVTARTDVQGLWRAEIAPMVAGGPHDLTITSDGQSLSYGNVLVGDVWICSGQSNMEWTVENSMDAEHEIAAANDPRIRHFKVPKSWAASPETTLAGGTWEPTDPTHVGTFTAVGYFFARELRKHNDVPIGLINTSWGGSRIEPWMSAESLGIDDAEMRKLLEQEQAYQRETLERINGKFGGLPTSDRGMVDGKAVWAEPAFDDSNWPTLEVPSRWEERGLDGMDGIVWYRSSIDLSATEARHGARLGLGTIDDSDISWVNGHEVGRTSLAWNVTRVYQVPAAFLREGRNQITVRVEDTGGGGGIWGYQGESNADSDSSLVYRDLFANMITDWRMRWNRGDLPFLWVQLANFMAASEQPGDSEWAVLRESQSAVLALPKTAQAVIIDIGDADDIHPRNKQEVGRRLALAARRVAYGEKIEFSGPVYRSHEVRGSRVIIDFDHTGGGLVARGREDRKLAEFAIAGADRHFVWAEAIIENNRVVVWSDKVAQPVAVRYAWA